MQEYYNQDNNSFISPEVLAKLEALAKLKPPHPEVVSILDGYKDKTLKLLEYDPYSIEVKVAVKQLIEIFNLVSSSIGQTLNSKPYDEQVEAFKGILNCYQVCGIILIDAKPYDEIDTAELEKLKQKYVEATI